MDTREDDDFILEQLASAEDGVGDLEQVAYQAGEALDWDQGQTVHAVERLIERGWMEGNIVRSWPLSDGRALITRVTAAGRDRADQLKRQTEIEE